ncbi:MAG: ABC transporter permease [Rhodospirillales bacterium]|nr:ABC transporter permease [Rhodospirillales bacterium]MBO6786072.1 ABC transporter permease [Rhodospirillales bacterium]
MNLGTLSIRSLLSRRWTVILTIFSIAVSVLLVLGVDRLRHDARSSFANTVSGTDLIVGARTGSVQLLLYSVFRIGNATSNISWKSHADFAADRRVAWTIPLALGDSHRGYRVLGTTSSYFEHYRYADGRRLGMADGKPFDDLFDVVVGAEVADALGYTVGSDLVIEHGLGGGINKHDNLPFAVSGILARTGTPVDRTIHVSLAALEAIHIDFGPAKRAAGRELDADGLRTLELKPRSITAYMVGLKSKTSIFSLQRDINNYRGEALMAILPGVAMHELWSTVSVAETALRAVSVCVLVSAFLGMMTMLLAGLNERRREMAILRAVGAGPRHIALLLVIEASALSAAGAGLGLAAVTVIYALLADWIGATYGLFLSRIAPTPTEWLLVAGAIIGGALAGLVPALRAARQSLADGLIVGK